MNSALRKGLMYGAIFGLTLFYVNDLVGNIFHPSLDEGIYLEGGERMLGGEVPYRDFFAFTGPVIYWAQASLEHVFGRNMPPLRITATASLALMTLVVFALTMRFTDWGYGLGAAAVYLSYIIGSPFMLIVNHRWLSAAMASLAVWAAVEAVERSAKPVWLWFLAGVAAAMAAWTTPSFLLGIGVYLVWLAVRDRSHLLPFCGGVVLVSVPAIAWLAAHGALLPMIDNLVWVSARYTKANAVPYGYNPSAGAFAWWDETMTPFARMMIGIALLRFAIAPVFGPLVALTYGFLAWRGKIGHSLQLLTLGAVAIFLTSYPRWDMNQLLFVMAPFAVLIALLVFRLPRLAQPVVTVLLALWAANNFSGAHRVVADYPNFPTRAGLQRGHISLLEGYERLERQIPEGSTLFAFPYLPSLGFSLHTRNPIRYTFLQPGMMSKKDEAVALGDLERHPPRFILRQYFPDDQVLNTWPNSDRSTLAMTSIREFIDRRYRLVDTVQAIYFRVELMELTH